MTILVDAPPSPLYLIRRTPKGKRRWGKGLTQTLSAAVDVGCAERVAEMAQSRGLSRCELLRRVYKTIDDHDLWDRLIDGKASSVASASPKTRSNE